MSQHRATRRSGWTKVMLALALSAGLALAPSASAQEAASPQSLLEDFSHYVRIDRHDAAAAMGQELLRRGLTPAEFVRLVETSRDPLRFNDTIARAMRVPSLEPIAGAMLKAFEEGMLAAARDPEQIRRNVAALTGTLRGKLDARARLIHAGEYAVPQLLEALLDKTNPALSAEAQRVLIDMGRQAITPLCTAMMGLGPTEQETVAHVLGLIPYRTSLPYLADLASSSPAAGVRSACRRAIERLAGSGAVDEPSLLYHQLAEAYYAHKSEVTSFPREDFQLLWTFAPKTGLVMQAIATPVFHEAMAMRLSRRALELSPGYRPALSLWIAANFRREIDTPAGYDNPAYGPGMREAMFYAVAAGPAVSLEVLARGLDTRDTPLVRRALSAVERTAGSTSLFGGEAARRPLSEALTYPNRRVQIEAALALAASHAREPFAGSDRVVPTLAAALTDASRRFALILARNHEEHQSYRAVIERGGFTVLPFGASLADVAIPISEAPAIDLVVVTGLDADRVGAAIESARGHAKLAATPVLALVGLDAAPPLQRRYQGESWIAVRPMSLDPSTTLRAAETLVERASGGVIGEAEAGEYARRALDAMRDLVLTGSSVFSVNEAAEALVSALGASRGETRMRVAEVLSCLSEPRAQVALVDAGLRASGQERIALLGKAAASARRFGNNLESRQVSRLLALASDAATPEGEATAAATLIGALNLDNADLLPMLSGPRRAQR